MTRRIRTTNKGIFVTGGEPEPAATEEVVIPKCENCDKCDKSLLKPATAKVAPKPRPDDVEPIRYGLLDQSND